MEARYSQHRTRKDRRPPNFTAAATFLAIYTTLYLAVAGVAHFMTSPDAAAASVPQAAAVATLPAEAIGTISELSASRSFAPEADELDNSRECQLDAGIDSACVFN